MAFRSAVSCCIPTFWSRWWGSPARELERGGENWRGKEKFLGWQFLSPAVIIIVRECFHHCWLLLSPKIVFLSKSLFSIHFFFFGGGGRGATGDLVEIAIGKKKWVWSSRLFLFFSHFLGRHLVCKRKRLSLATSVYFERKGERKERKGIFRPICSFRENRPLSLFLLLGCCCVGITVDKEELEQKQIKRLHREARDRKEFFFLCKPEQNNVHSFKSGNWGNLLFVIYFQPPKNKNNSRNSISLQ